MKITLICALLASAGLIAACGNDNASSPGASAPATSSGASAGASATTKTTPADVGQPGSLAEKKEGTNPVQGQVDPKQSAQHRDFQQRGDGAGPKSAETAPKSGG